MGRYIIRRLLWLFVVVFFVSLITFGFAHAVPGGPFDREKPLPEAIKRQIEQKYNLDAPLWQQYVDYMADILIPRIGPATSNRPAMHRMAAHEPTARSS